MDTVFNINRFANLIKREFVIYRKSYLFLICGIIAHYVIAMLIDSMYSIQMLKAMLILYLILIACVAPFLDKSLTETNASFTFSLPVSTFERFLILWGKCVIVMPLLILGISLILDFISSFFFEIEYTFSLFDSLESLHFLFAVQSVFLFGYVYFRKKAFVKTVMVIAAFFVIIIVVSKIVITQFYPEILHIKSTMDPLFIYEYDGYIVFNDNTYSKVTTGTTFMFDLAKYVIMAL